MKRWGLEAALGSTEVMEAVSAAARAKVVKRVAARVVMAMVAVAEAVRVATEAYWGKVVMVEADRTSPPRVVSLLCPPLRAERGRRSPWETKTLSHMFCCQR